MRIKFYRKKGFTLSEILIVLTIIGLIAALTVPGVMSHTSQRQKLTAFKRAYTNLVSAYAQYYSMNTVPEKSSDANTVDVFNAMYKNLNTKYFIVDGTKGYTAPTTAANVAKTWIVTEDNFKYKLGTLGTNDNEKTCEKKLTLNTMGSDKTIDDTKAATCYYITIDVSGSNKANNTVNSDQIVVYVSKQGIATGSPDLKDTDKLIAGKIIAGEEETLRD